jgi:hypothetical protein
MSTVVVLAPIIVANWPVITAVVGAAVGSMGFAVVRREEVQTQRTDTKTREEIEIDNCEILASGTGIEEEMVVEREGVRAIFSRDARGGLRVCMEGTGHSRSELRQLGQDLIDRVTQQYVYHRVVTELKARNMTIVDEEVAEDRTVKIRVRSW